MIPAKTGPSVIAASLAGASFIAVTQIVTLDRLDYTLVAAVILFAIEIPVLALHWIRPMQLTARQITKDNDPEIYVLEGFFAILALDVVAFALIFFHFGVVPGVAFVVSVALCLWIGQDKPTLRIYLKFYSKLLSRPFRRRPMVVASANYPKTSKGGPAN